MRLSYNKHTENLIEIAMTFNAIWERNAQVRNSNIESAEWKQYFIDWANEFERKYKSEDWRNGDYFCTIAEFTKKKISGLIGRRVIWNV